MAGQVGLGLLGLPSKPLFEVVRRAVSSVPCLTVIDYDAVKAGTQKGLPIHRCV